MSDWTPCWKRPVMVHVRTLEPGEAWSSTREGLTPVRPDDYIMRGVQGEEYPIGKDIFEQTYTYEPPPDLAALRAEVERLRAYLPLARAGSRAAASVGPPDKAHDAACRCWGCDLWKRAGALTPEQRRALMEGG